MRLALALAAALLLAGAQAQMMPGGKKVGRGAATEPAVKSDIPFIRCQVCDAVVKTAHREVNKMRSEVKPGAKV